MGRSRIIETIRRQFASRGFRTRVSFFASAAAMRKLGVSTGSSETGRSPKEKEREREYPRIAGCDPVREGKGRGEGRRQRKEISGHSQTIRRPTPCRGPFCEVQRLERGNVLLRQPSLVSRFSVIVSSAPSDRTEPRNAEESARAACERISAKSESPPAIPPGRVGL